MDLEKVDRVLAKYDHRHFDVIGIMQDVQAIDNYLQPEVLRYIAGKIEISLARIYDIATFYKAFSLKPRGRHVVKVCCGTACHLGGATRNLDQLKRSLAIGEGETTADRQFSIETVNCLGTCALAPVIVVDDDYHDAVDAGKIENILSFYRSEGENRV
jgi:NADH-quinone oxidoreductase subunit E